MNFVYLGHERRDAATNIAIDEAALHDAEKTGDLYIRFYDFEHPALILSHRESIHDINLENARAMGFDISRRLSHGSVIMCDDGVLTYSMACPSEYTPSRAHGEFGRKIGEVLKEIGVPNVGVGQHFSVRINYGTVAGHGQRWRMNRSLLYHGAMAVDPWDTNVINKVISLRTSPNGGKNEYEMICELPSIRQYVDIRKKELASKILHKLTGGDYKESQPDELTVDYRKLAETKYSNPKWIHEGRTGDITPYIASDLGFCFIDMLSPEGIVELI